MIEPFLKTPKAEVCAPQANCRVPINADSVPRQFGRSESSENRRFQKLRLGSASESGFPSLTDGLRASRWGLTTGPCKARDGYNWRMAAKKAGAKFVEVKASFAQQRGWRIFSFVIDSATFDRIAFVSRRDDDKDAGYQRNLSKQRASDIARYIDKENGCIPNSILVNLEDGANYDEKTQTLRIPDQPKAGWVIDGQHRMFGLRQARTTYDLVVTAFLGIDVAEQAKQFKIINSKQKGVPTSLLYDLLDLTKDGTFVQQRGHELATKLNEDPESPWYGQVDLTGSGDGLITQTRVVTAVENLISDRGPLFQYSEEEQYGILKN